MDFRGAGGDLNRLRALARELVGLQPDIIVTIGATATVAVQRETRTIPIVFTSVSDPVANGLVPRLDRPGGNVTGFVNSEVTLGGKWLELLAEVAPGLKRAAIMLDPDNPGTLVFLPPFETAARSLKVEPIIAPVHSDVEIETAIQRRRLALLRTRPGRHPSSRHLCRSHPARREAGRSACAVSDEI